MKQYVQELEKRNNRQKGEWIKRHLSDKGIPFHVQPFRTLLARGENIIVDYPFSKETGSSKRILLTAHYNAWFRTPGANDNASGVSVLLGYLERLIKDSKSIPLRIVFFDLEDGWAVYGGSKAYIRKYGVSDIEALYNLEAVGMGDQLLLWPSASQEWQNPLVHNAKQIGFSITRLKEFRITFMRFPFEISIGSDHIPFIKAGCTRAVAITTFPEADIRYADVIMKGKNVGKFVWNNLKFIVFREGDIPFMLKHYHNKDDRSEFIEQKNLDRVAELLWRIT